MHYPGHNPYVIEGDPFEFQNVGGSEWNIGSYGYQGMSPAIMDALHNLFGGHAGQMFDIQGPLQGFGWTGDDAHMEWTEAGLGLNVNPAGGWASDWAGVDISDFAIPGTTSAEGYDPSQGVLPFINVFDPESLAIGLSAMTGYDESIRPGEVRALTPGMIEKTTSAYYDPYETAGREELIEKRGKALGRATTGGFAGSGSRQAGLSGAERLYRGGYQDLIGDILKMRGDATGNVMDTIYGWQELMSAVTDE